MKRLIVNADDFGLHPAVNAGIIEGHRYGVITSASLIASGRAAEEAAHLSRENPSLGVGVHLTLVAERPTLPPDRVRSLVDEDGRMPADHIAFICRYALGKIDMSELFAECDAQISRVKSLGISPTHIDSHQHLHVLPGIAPVIAELSRKHHITRLRCPAEDLFFTGGYGAPLSRHIARAGLTASASFARGVFGHSGLTTPDHFFGMLAGGHMSEEHFLAVIRALPEGTSEVMIHPGADSAALCYAYHWGYHWEEELAAVTSSAAREYILGQSVRLISFGEL